MYTRKTHSFQIRRPEDDLVIKIVLWFSNLQFASFFICCLWEYKRDKRRSKSKDSTLWVKMLLEHSVYYQIHYHYCYYKYANKADRLLSKKSSRPMGYACTGFSEICASEKHTGNQNSKSSVGKARNALWKYGEISRWSGCKVTLIFEIIKHMRASCCLSRVQIGIHEFTEQRA